MSIDLSRAVGHKSADSPVSWNQRDLLLYAVGVGAKQQDYSLAYELDKNWAPLPTYPVVLGLKGNDQDLNNFNKKATMEPIPGFPKLDPRRVVHGSQSIEVLKTIPHVSGPGWKMTRRITSVTENKSGIIVESESFLVDQHGTPHAKLFGSSFYLGAKGTGEKFHKSIATAPQAKPVPKDRKPDWVISDQTTPEQAILYRLSGDYNPLHIDPAPGKASGFSGVILHGLATFGFAARGLISAVGGGDASSLKTFGVRFTAPVVPGDALETHVWQVGEGPGGVVEVTFVTKNLRTGKVVLGGGIAQIKKSEKSKL